MDVHRWEYVTANEPVKIMFDDFRVAKHVDKSDDNTALVIKTRGCYDLEYLVNVNSFIASAPCYSGIETYMAVNGKPILSAVKVYPEKNKTVATDFKGALTLNRNDKITLVLRSSANGTLLTVTPSAWLDVYYIGDRCR